MLDGEGKGKLASRIGFLRHADVAGGNEEPDHPEGFPAANAEAVERADHDEVLDRFGCQRHAADEIGQRPIGTIGDAFQHDMASGFLAHTLHIANANANLAVFDGAAEGAELDIGTEHPLAMAFGVVDQHVVGIKAHRLIVDERAEELGRVVVLQPA
ncbi:MAG: hypothetical protein R2848_06055 [Thermomicrobiales bacterium]